MLSIFIASVIVALVFLRGWLGRFGRGGGVCMHTESAVWEGIICIEMLGVGECDCACTVVAAELFVSALNNTQLVLLLLYDTLFS